jgi:small subunit ribosomal protein S1
MAQVAIAAPTREDFASMIDESFGDGHLQEGSVVKGTVVGIEKDVAVIDVGLKTEGRVALREFSGPGRNSEIKIGDTVEVYLERVENALGEAVLSRDKARREESWGKLEKAFQNNEKVSGVIFNQVKGGFTVDLGGIDGLLHVTHIYYIPVNLALNHI